MDAYANKSCLGFICLHQNQVIEVNAVSNGIPAHMLMLGQRVREEMLKKSHVQRKCQT